MSGRTRISVRWHVLPKARKVWVAGAGEVSAGRAIAIALEDSTTEYDDLDDYEIERPPAAPVWVYAIVGDDADVYPVDHADGGGGPVAFWSDFAAMDLASALANRPAEVEPAEPKPKPDGPGVP